MPPSREVHIREVQPGHETRETIISVFICVHWWLILSSDLGVRADGHEENLPQRAPSTLRNLREGSDTASWNPDQENLMAEWLEETDELSAGFPCSAGEVSGLRHAPPV
jgi:hypothetical protein